MTVRNKDKLIETQRQVIFKHKDKLYLDTKMDTCGAKKSANSTWRWKTEAQCMNVQVKNQSGTLGYHAFLEVVFMKDSVWSFLDQAVVDQ